MRSGLQAALDDTVILKNVSERLLDLASDTAQICKTVSELTESIKNTLSPSTIHDLQKLDNLHQSLCDLASLSAALAGPDDCRAEALSLLKLKATRTLVHQTVDDKLADKGSVDLF